MDKFLYVFLRLVLCAPLIGVMVVFTFDIKTTESKLEKIYDVALLSLGILSGNLNTSPASGTNIKTTKKVEIKKEETLE